MEEQLMTLKSILAEVSDLRSGAALLDWDQQCYMPAGGGEARGHHFSTLQRLAHERFTSDEVGELLEALAGPAEGLDPDSDDARLVKVTQRDFNKRTRVPADLIGEFYGVVGRAHTIWQEARAENNFAKFKPILNRIVDLRRQYAACFQPYEHVYDALLDDYEPGMKTTDVQAIFAELRPQQVELIQAIREKPQVGNKFLFQEFDSQKQWEFGEMVITAFGFDWKHGRQDKAAHPFTIALGRDDVRVTTRVDPQFLNPALFATMHECGHALYEQGSAPKLERTLLSGGASLAIHESQSRMWENLVGRSLSFWRYYYPHLQHAFPAQLGNVDLNTFYHGINQVAPSLIRVEADEATYNLHIMLRLEIEIGLMEGSLEVGDLPEIWNDRMQAYLGITPPNDKLGVLQDVHWSGGSFGYFATYALGNVISAQFWDKIQTDIPDLNDQIERGQFHTLLAWVREKIHRHGREFTPQELVQRVAGSKIDPEPYMHYLRTKYGQIYNL
ncbi:MAG: carboxypeptidase M32 [Anaerolineales bacterium]